MVSFFKNLFNSGEPVTIDQNALIVDVRSKNEFASGHLKGAVNIPLERVEAESASLKNYPQIVVYCRSGNRSAHAKKILNSSGISNVIDAGSLANVVLVAGKSTHHSNEIVKEKMPEISPELASLKDENVLKVLIPTDFSVQADFSYLMVRKLEEHLSIDTHFLHIMDVPDTVTMDSEGNIDTCGEIDLNYVKEQTDIAKNKLQHIRMQYGGHISVHFQLGKITDTITGFAEKNNFDLIVMGTKGAWGVNEKLSSTQAQMIARKSEVPLLSLMCDRSDLIINDILFVHDFMEADTTDIPLMNTFSKYFNASYHMLYIHNEPSVNMDKVNENIKKHAEKHQLKNYKSHFVKADNIEIGVKEFLKTQDADMVFVGTHGKGGFFHKSAAETLIKHLFKPIISFHIKN
jgi:rhodanese-related sulfurtransferase/nucleotide-binding universal stress UspA family protein